MIQYVVINDEDRKCFEKETHLPYGYGNHDIYITNDYHSALAFYNLIPSHIKRDYVIEKIEYGIAERVFPVISFTNNELH